MTEGVVFELPGKEVVVFRMEYSHFHRLRQSLALSCGFVLNNMEGYFGEETWDKLQGSEWLTPFFDHPADSGTLGPANLNHMADRLGAIARRWQTEYGPQAQLVRAAFRLSLVFYEAHIRGAQITFKEWTSEN